MPDIKLFVCCHRPAPVPRHPLLVPIQVGADLAGVRFPGHIQDDTGDNISRKNRSYCELTALYWAWKNDDADFCGLFHYRRFLYPDEQARRPYRLEGAPTEALLDRLGFGYFADLIPRYDMILPLPENMHVPVREHYGAAPFHHGRDLALMEQIVRELSPAYAGAMDAYLSGTQQHFGNICILRREVLEEYCAWLFPLLEEFDRRTDTTGYSTQEQRVDGYLAERLLGVYYTRRQAELRALALPRVHFEESPRALLGKKTLNLLLPPGSKLRSRIKQVVKHGNEP